MQRKKLVYPSKRQNPANVKQIFPTNHTRQQDVNKHGRREKPWFAGWRPWIAGPTDDTEFLRPIFVDYNTTNIPLGSNPMRL